MNRVIYSHALSNHVILCMSSSYHDTTTTTIRVERGPKTGTENASVPLFSVVYDDDSRAKYELVTTTIVTGTL